MPSHPHSHLKLAIRGSMAASLLIATLCSAAQTPTQIPLSSLPQQSRPLPLSRLYFHFFLYEARLEHLAQTKPALAAKGGNIKDHLRKRTGLSEAEWGKVSSSSLRVETSYHALNAQAEALISADRKLCQATPAACQPSPPNVPQLRELDRRRDQMLDGETRLLEASLGSDATAKLRAFLNGEMADHIKTTTVTPAALKAARQGVTQ